MPSEVTKSLKCTRLPQVVELRPEPRAPSSKLAQRTKKDTKEVLFALKAERAAPVCVSCFGFQSSFCMLPLNLSALKRGLVGLSS